MMITRVAMILISVWSFTIVFAEQPTINPLTDDQKTVDPGNPSVPSPSPSPVVVKMQWFDGSGAFHYDDPIVYINKVLAGEIKDAEISAALKEIKPEIEKVTVSDLQKIADVLQKRQSIAAIFLPGESNLSTDHDTLLKSFQEKAAQNMFCILRLQGYGMEMKGPIGQLGGSSTNLVLAVPADPLLIPQLTNEWEGNVRKVELLLTNAAQSEPWSRFASRAIMDSSGSTMLMNMLPGTWLVYVNQYGILTYLYRIIVRTDENPVIVLEKNLGPSMMKVHPKIPPK